MVKGGDRNDQLDMGSTQAPSQFANRRRSPRWRNSARRRWRCCAPNCIRRILSRCSMEKALFPDAVRFLAHALPKREAVWWAWVCARAGGRREPAAEDQGRAGRHREMDRPAHRREPAGGHGRGRKGRMVRAAGCAGLAAFFSGGSLAPPDAPVPPGEFLTAKAVSGAVIFAAVAKEPEERRRSSGVSSRRAWK